MQVCHGKAAPLKRLQGGDVVVYYSPVVHFGEKTPCQSFTAIGCVKDKAPYQVHMFDEFYPYRRDVEWFDSEIAAIKPLLPMLSFTSGNSNWGYKFRFGLFEIAQDDIRTIARAMLVAPQFIS
ncbi:EVE domain-containing protein [Pragia fontium DSM 5563 = ATCC 49100]|uniref:EVE domain-containing protein n=2 Tax=Pragia fontium TaxID=82985 RepID=A0AAJ5BHM1_9GAMM|nr:EVE domain-containing protein [Pragia fontium DSM 5563 = ATCC 49100]